MSPEGAQMKGRAPSSGRLAFFARRRPAALLLAGFLALEALARLVGGYSLASLNLRPAALAADETSIFVSRFATQRRTDSAQAAFDAEQRKRLRLWRRDAAPLLLDEDGAGAAVMIATEQAAPAAAYRNPQNAILPGGFKTDEHGWLRDPAAPPATSPAVRIAFVGGDFLFGEKGISLPPLVQEKLRRMDGQPPFALYNLAREGVGFADLATLIESEAAALKPHLVVIDEMALFAAPNRFTTNDRIDKDYVRRANAILQISAFREFYAPPRFSALFQGLTMPSPDLKTKTHFDFDPRKTPPEADVKIAAMTAAISAARRAGADVLVLGPRAPIRPGQAYPRWRSSLRANWYDAEGPANGRRFWAVYRKDAEIGRATAEANGADYFSFAPLAGRLQYFDDDLSLSPRGYDRAAYALAERIAKLARARAWRPTPAPDLSALAAPVAARKARWSCAAAPAPTALAAVPSWRAAGPAVVARPDGATFELDTKKRMTFIAATPLAPILADLALSTDRRVIVRGALLRGAIAIRTARNAGQRHFGAAPVVMEPGPFAVELNLEDPQAARAEIFITNESKRGSAVRLDPPQALAAPCTLIFDES
jgi:hypothetical protein